jgi:indole-3-glycerol phosphate synthase
VNAFLEEMLASSHSRAARARAAEPFAAVRSRALEMPPPPGLHLDTFDLIAEIKPRSPSAGVLSERPDVVDRVAAYSAGGAAAISVLTEPSRFGGSLADLRRAAEASTVPVMRKDFLVDEYQVFEARAAGAGGVLLIREALADSALETMLDAARACGMFVLLESFSEEGLRQAIPHATDGVLLGVNSRDLRTLAVDTRQFDRFAADACTFVAVAESGLETVDDVVRVARLGYRLALVGSALMRAPAPADLIAGMVRAGRDRRCT